MHVDALQHLSLPLGVWEDISMDFIEELPALQRKNTILLVVDKMSKYAHFLALSYPYTAMEIV